MLKRILTAVFLLAFAASGSLYSSSTATATVTYSVGSVDAISVSGNPGALTINTAAAGSALTPAVDTSTTYAVTTNNSSKAITGSISPALGTGFTLNIGLAAPSGASSSPQNMTTTAQNLITGLNQQSASGLMITYTLSATLAAAQGSPQTTTVTYTIQ